MCGAHPRVSSLEGHEIPVCCEARQEASSLCAAGHHSAVCERWQNSYTAFLEDMGRRPSPGHSLDRYPDKNGNYEPGNVRWATIDEQNRNSAQNNIVKINGTTMCLTDAARLHFTPVSTVRGRVMRGWPLERALNSAIVLGCTGTLRLG